MFGSPARSRLLPMSLPFRYFGAAVVFQIAAWAVLLFSSYDLNSFEGGLGPVFAALHLLTLGVLAMTAVGATLQLLPVATRQPVRSLGAARLVWWLLVPATALFAAGGAAYAPRVMAPGAALAVLALAIFAWLFFRNLQGARGMKLIVAHGWAALACLLALAATGLALVMRYEHGIALDHAAFRAAHLVLASYGFMGLLAMGLAHLLLPMFAVAPPPQARAAYAGLAAAIAGIILATAGFILPAVLAGLAAAVTHVVSMERALRSRLRPELGPAFLLVRVSWACLIASLGLAGLMALELAPPRAAVLFGALLVPGWLLSFLLGVMQRIVPFLASMHAAAGHVTPLTPVRTLAVHRVLHLAALAALLLGIYLNTSWLVSAGAAAGLAAAAAFGVFFTQVISRSRKLGIQSPHQPAPA